MRILEQRGNCGFLSTPGVVTASPQGKLSQGQETGGFPGQVAGQERL